MKAIRVRFFGATPNRPARYIADDGDGNNQTTPVSVGDRDAAALALCAKMDWSGILHKGEFGGDTFYVWDETNEWEDGVIVIKDDAERERERRALRESGINR